jgi:hypothetical protein
VTRHGTYAGYQAGCRSTCCVQAERAYQAQRKRAIAYGRPLKVPSIGSVRRIQALMANGWTGTYLAERLDVRRTNLPTHTRYPTIRTWKAEQIRALYNELHLKAGPSDHTRQRAAPHGFLPPECWDGIDIDNPNALPILEPLDPIDPGPDIDDIAVERAVAGDRSVKLNQQERTEAIRLLIGRGLTDSQINDRLGINRQILARLRDTHLEQAS